MRDVCERHFYVKCHRADSWYGRKHYVIANSTMEVKEDFRFAECWIKLDEIY